MSQIDQDVIDQATDLFDGEPPANAAYYDTEPVTITITKGQAYNVEAALRNLVQQVLSQLQMKEAFGIELEPDDVTDTETTLRDFVALDAVLQSVAPVSDYPMSDDEREKCGLPAREPAVA